MTVIVGTESTFVVQDLASILDKDGLVQGEYTPQLLNEIDRWINHEANIHGHLGPEHLGFTASKCLAGVWAEDIDHREFQIYGNCLYGDFVWTGPIDIISVRLSEDELELSMPGRISCYLHTSGSLYQP